MPKLAPDPAGPDPARVRVLPRGRRAPPVPWRWARRVPRAFHRASPPRHHHRRALVGRLVLVTGGEDSTTPEARRPREGQAGEGAQARPGSSDRRGRGPRPLSREARREGARARRSGPTCGGAPAPRGGEADPFHQLRRGLPALRGVEAHNARRPLPPTREPLNPHLLELRPQAPHLAACWQRAARRDADGPLRARPRPRGEGGRALDGAEDPGTPLRGVALA